MDDFDELLPTADEEGRLDLSHRAWCEIDEVVWTMGGEVSDLKLCHNRLTSVPSDVGFLKLLRELDVSCNKIGALPSSIGKLRCLRTLKCNGNDLEDLPVELGSCSRLQDLICSENNLKTLPRSLGTLRDLRRILAQNNALETLPPTLGDLEFLVDINARGNGALEAMIPKQIQNDTPLILWVLRTHRKHERHCENIIRHSDQLKMLINNADDRAKQLAASLHNLNDDRLGSHLAA